MSDENSAPSNLMATSEIISKKEEAPQIKISNTPERLSSSTTMLNSLDQTLMNNLSQIPSPKTTPKQVISVGAKAGNKTPVSKIKSKRKIKIDASKQGSRCMGGSIKARIKRELVVHKALQRDYIVSSKGADIVKDINIKINKIETIS